MAFEDTYLAILQRLPGIQEPDRSPNFKTRLKWTALIVVAYFVMTQITVFGVASQGY